MVEFQPTAQTCLASPQETAVSPSYVFTGGACVFQVLPPFVVATVTAVLSRCSPTAQPCRSSAKDTPLRTKSPPGRCAAQVAPPFVVASTVLPMPTAQPWFASGNETASRSLPCGVGFCQTQAPSPVETAAAAPAGNSNTMNAVTAMAASSRYGRR